MENIEQIFNNFKNDKITIEEAKQKVIKHIVSICLIIIRNI